MTVRDLIWELQQIHNQKKEVNFGTNSEDEREIHAVVEKEFVVYLQE